jgi:hypothetical protein
MQMKKKRKPKFPVGTLAYYGPDNVTTTMIVAGILYSAEAKPIIRRYVASDCLSNDRIQRQVFEFFADHGVKTILNRVPDFPEFNLYSSPGPIRELGWERLRQITEENASALRGLNFIRPDLASKGAVSPDEPVQVFKIPTKAGTLVLCPIIDSDGYRSISFRFMDEPSPVRGSPEWADQWGESMGWPKKLRGWPGNN